MFSHAQLGPSCAAKRAGAAIAATALLAVAAVSAAPNAHAIVDIDGTVYNDPNGLTDSTIGGTGVGALGAWGQLYVTALAGGAVVDSVPVDAGGSYAISGLPDGSYDLVLSRYDESAQVGSTPRAGASIPADWEFVGEGITSGGDGTPDGVVTLNASGTVNFGVRTLDTDRDGEPDISDAVPGTCWDIEFAGDGVLPTGDRTMIMHSGSSQPNGSPALPADAFKPRNTSNFARIGAGVSAVSDIAPGPALNLAHQVGPASHQITVNTATTTLQQAKDQDSYVGYTFTTDGDFAMAYIDWVGFLNRIDQEAFDVTVSIQVGSEPFIDLATFNEALNDGHTTAGKENEDIEPYALAHNTTYTVRYYFYNVTGPLDFDDPYIAFDACPYAGLNGTVYIDANGLADSTVNAGTANGEATGAPGGVQMYATVIGESGDIVASVPVNADGTYAFDRLMPGNYTVQVGTVDTTGSVGHPADPPTTPTGFYNTGEHTGGGTGDDGTPDGQQTIAVVPGTNAVDFGLQRPPVVVDVSAADQLNPGGTTQVTVPTLLPSDPEDGTLTTVIIDTLPTEGTLYYNGTAVSAGQQIDNYDPTLLTVDPDDGEVSVEFTYSTVDAAGAVSAPADVVMPFGTVGIDLVKSVSGITDTNGNGLTDAGDVINYSFVVTNTGSRPLTDVVVTDPLVTVVGGPVDLAVGGVDSTTFTASYEIQTADVVAGGVENTATVSGDDPAGDPVTD
ncbi:MAG: hypothetical protein ACK5H2_04990, partial [Beutenbergiaceae bacterium]